MSRIDRIRRAVQARSASRTEAGSAEQGGETLSVNLPVAVGPAPAPRGFREDRRRVDNAFAAQMLGQDGQRRGLRAGPGIVDIAQAAYNRVEWSGSYDRRARKGRQTRTDI